MEKTGEWGRFFPPALSFDGYNDTLEQEYFPLTREAAIQQGFLWNDYMNPKVEGAKKIPADRLPEDIASVPDDILNWAIECAHDKKMFKIIPQELKFYRDHHLPVPHFCPACRHYARKDQINPRKLYSRACAKCKAEIQTTYSTDRPEIVYCESCYMKEIY
ncbi:hypothetical protein HZA43_00975 [Candidatus Peregrinibacteria bacterium]|nr:hypothetical protein [Candidatus Peregrinibacteria bacterium]